MPTRCLLPVAQPGVAPTGSSSTTQHTAIVCFQCVQVKRLPNKTKQKQNTKKHQAARAETLPLSGVTFLLCNGHEGRKSQMDAELRLVVGGVGALQVGWSFFLERGGQPPHPRPPGALWGPCRGPGRGGRERDGEGRGRGRGRDRDRSKHSWISEWAGAGKRPPIPPGALRGPCRGH